MAKYIFNHLSEINSKLIKSKQLILFLDYDGTLVSFKNDPYKVKTPLKVKKILRELTEIQNFKVIIITGRTLENTKDLITNKKIIICAIHGLKIKFPNKEKFIWKKAKITKPLIEKIKNLSVDEFEKEKKVIIEDKELTLAFHYRQVSEVKTKKIIKDFIQLVNKIDVENQLEILKGAKVIEVRPKGWDKGKAIEKILHLLNINKKLISIYIGDDITDEDAFKFLKNKGITIFVSNDSDKNTLAEYNIKNPNDVLKFLQWIINRDENI